MNRQSQASIVEPIRNISKIIEISLASATKTANPRTSQDDSEWSEQVQGKQQTPSCHLLPIPDLQSLKTQQVCQSKCKLPIPTDHGCVASTLNVGRKKLTDIMHIEANRHCRVPTTVGRFHIQGATSIRWLARWMTVTF